MSRHHLVGIHQIAALAFAAFAVVGVGNAQRPMAPSDRPADQGTPANLQKGDANAGRDVFRFETFGNEGFWTDAVRAPDGMKAAKVTPLMAMKLGVSVDVDALDGATLRQLVAELRKDPTGKTSRLLNDPETTVKLT
jgi:hypothetical protein